MVVRAFVALSTVEIGIARAQETDLPLFADSLRVGMRVRVFAPGVTRFARETGVITSVDSTTFFFKDELTKTLLLIPKDRVQILQVSTGRHATRRHLISGGAIGFLAGLGLAQILDSRDRDEFGRRSSGCISTAIQCIGKKSVLIGTVTGVTAGVAIAWARPPEIWRSVRLR